MSKLLKSIFGKKNAGVSDSPVHLNVDQKTVLTKKERKALLDFVNEQKERREDTSNDNTSV